MGYIWDIYGIYMGYIWLNAGKARINFSHMFF